MANQAAFYTEKLEDADLAKNFDDDGRSKRTGIHTSHVSSLFVCMLFFMFKSKWS